MKTLAIILAILVIGLAVSMVFGAVAQIGKDPCCWDDDFV